MRASLGKRIAEEEERVFVLISSLVGGPTGAEVLRGLNGTGGGFG